MEGLAQEMGRQEDKLNRLLSMAESGGGGGSCPDIPVFPDLSGLLELLTSIDGAGGYELVGPCNSSGLGSADDPLTAEWGLTVGFDRAILKRLDALAELLQHHKNLKQPICTPGRAMGTPVTVTFEEMPEA
jgi:hypothetical protein